MNRIQLEEEQEQLEQDSKKLEVKTENKRCYNCKNIIKRISGKHKCDLIGINISYNRFIISSFYCSEHTMKDKEEG